MSIAAPDYPPDPSAGEIGDGSARGPLPTDDPRAARTPGSPPAAMPRNRFSSTVEATAGTEIAGFAEIAEYCRTSAARMFDSGRTPGAEQLGWLGEAAARWARDALPLSAILCACQEGLRTAFASVAVGTPAREVGEVLGATDLMLELLRSATAVICDAYVDEEQDLGRARHAATQTLASALLSGQAGVAAGRRNGLPVADSYQVVALFAPAHPDEFDTTFDAQAVAARTLRRLQTAVANMFGAQAPALLSPIGGTLLLPRGADGRELTTALLTELSGAAGVPLSAASVIADTERVPEAAEQAHELLELVLIAGRGPGLYRLADLAMEYLLTRGGQAGRELARLLDPLDAHPELFDTARAYLRNDMNRRLTARQLFVHPNTVDYRLRRIVALTGMDLATAEGIARATAALLARASGRHAPGRGHRPRSAETGGRRR